MKKIIYVNLNFDDFHPQSQFDHTGDFAGYVNNGNFKKIRELLKEFPTLKITMFAVANWIDTPYLKPSLFYKLREILKIFPVVRPRNDEPFLLRKHPEWCEAVRELIEEGRLEIAVHGYYHFNPTLSIHGQEFCGLSKDATRGRIFLAEKEFAYNQIPFFKAFRPPGWGTNRFLPEILRELDYKIYATQSSHSQTHEVEIIDGLKTLPQNWSIRESKEEAISRAAEQGVLFMKGHLAYQYGKEIIENGINDKHWNNLRGALKELTENFEVKFISLSELITRQK